MKLLSMIKDYFKNHTAFSLTLTNLVLVLLIVLFRDPFGFFEKNYSKSKPFFEGTAQGITKIIIKRSTEADGERILELNSENWLYKNENKSYRADREKVDQLLKSIFQTRRFTSVSTDASKKEEFGIGGMDAFDLSLYGGEDLKGTLHIGTTGAGGAYTYVSFNEESTVYLVEENLKPTFGRGSNEFFIQTRISPSGMNSSDIQTISIKYSELPDKNFELVKTEGTWKKIPGDIKIKSDSLTSLLTRMTSLLAEQVVTELDVSDLDLGNQFDLLVTYSGKDKKTSETMSFRMIGFSKSENLFYLRKDSDPNVYKVSEYQIKPFLEYSPEVEN